MKVYIAGPMAGNLNGNGQNYRKKIKTILRKYGIDFVCPLELDFGDLGKEESIRLSDIGTENGKNFTSEDISIMKDMVERDLSAIDSCDVLISYTPFPSYGTDMETFYHSRIKNGVTIIFSKNPKSWMIALGDYFVKSYTQLDELMKNLKELEADGKDN